MVTNDQTRFHCNMHLCLVKSMILTHSHQTEQPGDSLLSPLMQKP
jgi:hypothetical protein